LPFPKAARNGKFLLEYIWTQVVVFPDLVRPMLSTVCGIPGRAGLRRTLASLVPGNFSIANLLMFVVYHDIFQPRENAQIIISNKNKKMTEVRQAREIDLLPEELRFQPSVKSDIIIQRRAVSLAPIEAAQTYTRDGTNTLTWNIQGHRELSQLLDSKSLYFTWKVKFDSGYPVEDVAMLVEEVIISSNGRTLERIRNAQYIQHFLRGYGMSRTHKAKLGKDVTHG
jgi:hypothetical protein